MVRGEWLRRVRSAGAQQVDGASAAVFRIAFGIAMTVNVMLYLPYLVHDYYVAPSFTFGYPPFDALRPLPGMGMQLVYTAMGVLGLTIAAGLWYRASCALFAVATTYVFLLDSSYFQNHEYLISLLSLLMVFLPLHRRWSLDAWRRPGTVGGSATIPAWVLWLLRFQIGVPYFFGGIAKINGDWLRGEPLRMWLAERTDVPLIGRFYTDEPMVLFMTYGSLLFDLLVVWLLLNRRTRPLAFAVAVCFHLLNARMFGLYVFPWLMIAATLIFFRPDWPVRLGRRLSRLVERRRPAPPGTAPALPERDGVPELVGAPAAPGGSPAGRAAGSASVRGEPEDAGEHATAGNGVSTPPSGAAPESDSARGTCSDPGPGPAAGSGSGPGPGSGEGTGPTDGSGGEVGGRAAGAAGARLPMMAPALVALLAAWMVIQAVVPLRHLVVPGDPNWTERGHRFAWHMMLRTKQSSATFTVTDGERTWQVRNADHLTPKQEALMAGHPERIVLFARHLSQLHGGAEVRVESWVRLNGRAPARLIDPDTDLAAVPLRWYGGAEWILPLEEPLRR